MSDCRMCDTCGNVFSILDENARRLNIEEKVKVGARVEIQVVTRDACGDCLSAMNGRRKPTAEITAGTVPGL